MASASVNLTLLPAPAPSPEDSPSERVTGHVWLCCTRRMARQPARALRSLRLGRLFEPVLLEHQVGNDLSQVTVFHLERGHDIRLPATAAPIMAGGGSRGRPGRTRWIELAPAMERHDTDT